MRIFLFLLAGVFAAGASARGATGVPEWAAILPGRTGAAEFEVALEAANGDVLVSGRDSRGTLLVRLKPDGTPRWAQGYPKSPGMHTGSTPLGLYETAGGVISLWACCDQPGWTAIRHDDTGGAAARLDLGYPRGSLDVSPSARVLFLSFGAGGMPEDLHAEGRSLADGSAWTAALPAADMHEVIGIYALGDSAVAVLDRLGGPAGDTLMVRAFDGTGRSIWSRDLPMGPKSADYQGLHSINWSHFAHDPGGRMVLAGIAPGFPRESAQDSLALAVFGPAGDLLRLKRFACPATADSSVGSSWKLASLSAASAGIRAGLYHHGFMRFWSSMDISWSGTMAGLRPRSPVIEGLQVNFQALSTPSGAYLGFGILAETENDFMPILPDSIWRPSGMLTPSLFGPGTDPESWSPHPLREFADTVWSRFSPTPAGPTPVHTLGPRLGFMVFTRDGGAVTGGRLWKREGQDTLAVVALKIPPSGTGGLEIRASRPGRWAPTPGMARRFDAAGRLRSKSASPVYLRPAESP